MDTWKFYDITHRRHLICNPSSVETFDEVIEALDLAPGARLLDVGSGKGEFLVRTIERFGGPAGEGVRAVAVDVSPFVIAELREKVAGRVPRAAVEALEMDAAAYGPQPDSFDLAVCLGASWIYGGYAGTLRALSRAVRPGGLVLSGEPFWKRAPPQEYLDHSGLRGDLFGTHEQNVAQGLEAGLVPMLALPSTDREWDRYETLQWAASARYAAEHPDDPDVPELLARVGREREAYLRWGRDALGWAIYLFVKRESSAAGGRP